MKRIIVILVSVFTTGTAFAYTGGLPWWLISNTNSVTNSSIAVESVYAIGTNTTRLILSGDGVTDMTVNGRTTTVVFAAGGTGTGGPQSPFTNNVNGAMYSLTNTVLQNNFSVNTNAPTPQTNRIVGHVVWTNGAGGASSGGLAANAVNGIWQLSEDMTLVQTLSNLQSLEAGLWKVNVDGSVSPSTNDWYDSLWIKNSDGSITPR